MKVPKEHQAWPNLYRWGFEDGKAKKPNVEDRFVGKAALAYAAGYSAGRDRLND